MVQKVKKNLPVNAGDAGSIPGLGRSPGGGHGNPCPSHGQRSLVGYSPWGRKESDTPERLSNNKVCLRARSGLSQAIRFSFTLRE